MSNISIERDSQSPAGYVLRAQCVVPRPLDEVFAYFADATNLERLTPPWLRFEIVTPRPIEMHAGAILDYRLRVHGVPLRWQSEITAWDPPYRFIDEARRSPYRYWRHEHRFERVDRGTRVLDEVQYAVPGGRLVHWLAVERDLRKIFMHRQQALAEQFATAAAV